MENQPRFTAVIVLVACIQRLQRNITISPEQSYAGKAKQQLTNLKIKFDKNSEFIDSEIAFLSSIGDIFPIYDYIILESISGVTILEISSELIASYTLVQHLKEVITEIRRAVTSLGAKQVSDEHLARYLKELVLCLELRL
ncbi:F pilus assembly TraH domain protein [Orientia tsutsugamushi str. TA763]|nr:F pilus assembly TraH domain protein [Orientia tsutsugamushi str. TA763]